jgi:hypothetical protein
LVRPAQAAPRTGIGLTARGRLVGAAIQFAVSVILTRLQENKLEAQLRRQFTDLYDRDVAPELAKRLQKLDGETARLTEEDPFATVYARVTLSQVTRYLNAVGAISSWPSDANVKSVAVADVVVSRDRQDDEQHVTGKDTKADPFSDMVVETDNEQLSYSVAIPLSTSLDQRVLRSVQVAIEHGIPLRRVVADRGGQWTADQRDAYMRAYIEVTRGRPELTPLSEDALRYQAEVAREAQIVGWFGRADFEAARAAVRLGRSVRELDAMTHWGSEAQRERFVRAYIEVARDHPLDRRLYDDAFAFLDEITRPERERQARERRERERLLREWIEWHERHPVIIPPVEAPRALQQNE